MQRSSSSSPAVAGRSSRRARRVGLFVALAAANVSAVRTASAADLATLFGIGRGDSIINDRIAVPVFDDSRVSDHLGGSLKTSRPTLHSDGLEATLTWDGTTGTWSDSTKWGGSLPAASDTLNFPSSAAAYTTTNNLIPLANLTAVNTTGSGTGAITFAGGFASASVNLATGTTGTNVAFTNGTYQLGNALATRPTFRARGTSVVTFGAGAVITDPVTNLEPYLWESSVLNINAGSAVNLGVEDSWFSVDDDASLNVNAGATARIDWLTSGNDVTSGTRKIKVSGIGATLNTEAVFVTNLKLFSNVDTACAASTEVSAGGIFNSASTYLNYSAPAAGLNGSSTLTVNGGTVNVRDLTAADNAVLTSGRGGARTTSTIAVSNGGKVNIVSTGTTNFGFSSLGVTAGSVTNMTVGGTGTGGVRSSYYSQDAIFLAANDSDFSSATTATVTVTNGGDFGVGLEGFIQTSADNLAVTTLNVSGTGVIDSGAQLSLNGGNQGNNPASPTDAGAGTTNVNVTAGGTFRADVLEVMADPAFYDTEGGVTNITVDGAGSKFLVDGTDNPATTTLESGFLLTSFGITDASNVFIPGTDTGKFGKVNYTVTNGGLFDVNEVAFAGDLLEGTTTIAVSGVGSKFDAGGGLIVNSAGLANSNVTITVSGGGELAASADSSGALGGIVLNGTAGSGTLAVNVTGAGSTLRSADVVFIGGTAFENATTGDLDLVAGTPATVTTGAGTNFIAGGNVYVAAGSSLTTGGRYEALNTIVSGSWTINGGNASRIVKAGGLFLDGTATVNVTPTNATAPVLVTTGNIDVPTGASIELHKNALQITPFGSPATTVADVKALIVASKIKSADLTANTALGIALVSTPGTFLGSPTAAGDILVRYTLLGDADLSGNVNFDDLLKLAANYNTPSGTYWYQGDFTNDGAVNFDDLLKLAANYNQSLTGSFAGDWALAQSAVPEPTSLLAIGLGGAALLGRRRRR
jgi:hypothetical protein